MRILNRNKQTIYYALYEGKVPLRDEYGNETGEYAIQHSPPVAVRLNVSAARGESATRAFGESEDYDKILVTNKTHLPITPTSLLWVDVPPPAMPDYSVRRIARSLNYLSIAVSKIR